MAIREIEYLSILVMQINRINKLSIKLGGFQNPQFLWWSAVSSKCLFIEAAFHQMACSSNAQFHLVFKTVSRISVALLHPKLLMIE